ncbi:hypothetical protein SNE40_015637 [Patella caerulea]
MKIGSYLAAENITEELLMKKTELQSFVEKRQREIKITNGILVDLNYYHLKNNIPFTKIHQLVNILTHNFLTQHNVGCDQLRFQIKTAVNVRKEVLHLNRDAFMNVENKLFVNKDKNILSSRQKNCAVESETVTVSGNESNADIQEKLSDIEEIDTGPLNCCDQVSADSSTRSPTFNKGISNRDPSSVKLTQVRWPRHKKQIAAEYQAAQQAPVNGHADKPDDSIISSSSSFSNIELTESGLSGYSSPNRKTHDIHNDRSTSNTNDRNWPTVSSSNPKLCEQQGQEKGPEITLISPVVIIEKMDMPSQKISSCVSERMDILKRKSSSFRRTVSKTVSEIMESPYPKGSVDTFDIDTTGVAENMDTPYQKQISSGVGVSEELDSPDLKRTSSTVSAVLMGIPTEGNSSINGVSETVDTANPQITSSTAETINNLNQKNASSAVSETSDIQNPKGPASTVRISEIVYSPTQKTNATLLEKWPIPMSPHIHCGNHTESHCPGQNSCNEFIKQLSSVGITETMLENRNLLKAHVDNYPQKITLTNAMVLQLNRYRIKYHKTWNAFACWVTVLSYSQTSHYTLAQLRQRLQKFSKMYGSLRSETGLFLNKRFIETLDSVIENPRANKDKGNCINVAAEIHQSQHDEPHIIQEIQNGHDDLLNEVHLNSQDQVQQPTQKILGPGQLAQHHTRELRQHTQEVRHCTQELRQHAVDERQQTCEIPNNEILNNFENECPQSPCIANMNIPVPRLQDSVMGKCTCVTMDTRVDEQSTDVLSEADDSFFVSGKRKLQCSKSNKNKEFAIDSTRRYSLIDGYLSYLKQQAVDIDNGETLKSTNNLCCNSYTRINNKYTQRSVSMGLRNSENELHLSDNLSDSGSKKVTTGKKSLRFDVGQYWEIDGNTASQEYGESLDNDTLCHTTVSELAPREPINSPNLDTLWCRQSCVYKQKLTNSRQIMHNKMIRVLSFVENKLKFIVESNHVSRTKRIPTDTSLATVMKNSIYSTMEDIRNYRKRFLESESDKETESTAPGKKMKSM